MGSWREMPVLGGVSLPHGCNRFEQPKTSAAISFWLRSAPFAREPDRAVDDAPAPSGAERTLGEELLGELAKKRCLVGLRGARMSVCPIAVS